MRKRIIDAQRGKVYAWERSSVGGYVVGGVSHFLSLGQCRALANRALAHYGLPRLRRMFLRDGYIGTANPVNWEIQLAVPCLFPAYVLHETAHLIVDHFWCLALRDILWRTHQPHGPEFMGVYMYLLNRYTTDSTSALATTARDAGLEFRGVLSSRPRDLKEKLNGYQLQSDQADAKAPAHPARCRDAAGSQ